jgi:hypothetical protein
MHAKGLGIAMLALVLCATVSQNMAAQQMEPGLVTAMDRIGGTLLGTSSFDAVLTNSSDSVQPQRLRIDLSLAQGSPVEIVLIGGPGDTNPTDPVRAFFRMTVGGTEGLKFEYDPTAGEIIPCIEPPADLSAIPLAPADSGNPTASLRAGLVNALGEVGKNLLGLGRFDATIAESTDRVQPQRLRLFVDWTSPMDILIIGGPGDNDPSVPVRPIFRMVLGGAEEAELQVDENLPRLIEIVEADLSSLVPPGAVR